MVCRRCFAHRCLRQGDRLVKAAQPAAQADSRFAARFARRSRLRLSRGSLGRWRMPKSGGSQSNNPKKGDKRCPDLSNLLEVYRFCWH